MTSSSSQRILAVDPGMQYLGVAVLEGEDLIWYGIKTFPGHDARPQIKHYLTSLFQKYQPTMLVVEEPFYAQSLLSDNLKKLTREIKTWGKWKGRRRKAGKPGSKTQAESTAPIEGTVLLSQSDEENFYE